MARIRTRSGPPEIEALVAAAAERQPMLSMALSISETASGADVLLDIGEHMAVFSREQARLVHLMRRVLGRGMVSTFRFLGSPARGVLGQSTSGFEAYRPARPGWPVIVLTDLGIGAGGGPSSEWLEFSRLVRSGGCHLLALVPYPPARGPRISHRRCTSFNGAALPACAPSRRLYAASKGIAGNAMDRL